MAKIGYARVSTQDQLLDLQINALEKEGCTKIFTEKVSGRSSERPEFKKCMEFLREGDTLVVHKLDRLGRTTRQLLELVGIFQDRGIQFQAITNGIDTSSAQGRFFFTIMAGFSEMEAELISERTKAGLESARARGRKGGRPVTDSNKIDYAFALYDSKKYTIAAIEEKTGVSKSTLYKELKKREVN